MKKLFSIDVYQNRGKFEIKATKEKLDDILPDVVAVNRAQLNTLSQMVIEEMMEIIMDWANSQETEYYLERKDLQSLN